MMVLKDSGKPYEVNPDSFDGLRQAVINGQLRMALDYAVVEISKLNDSVRALKTRLVALEVVAAVPEEPAVESVDVVTPRRTTRKTRNGPDTDDD